MSVVFYLADILRTSSLGDSMSDNAEKTFLKRHVREPEYIGVFFFFSNKRPGRLNIRWWQLTKETRYLAAAGAAAKSLQSCPTLCDPIDGSPRGSPVPGILQARTLQWVAISFSNAWKWKVKVKPLSRVRLLATPWTAAYQAPPSMGFSRQGYWSGVPLPSPRYLELRNLVLFLCVGRKQESGLTEVFPWTCTPAIWSQDPLFSHIRSFLWLHHQGGFSGWLLDGLGSSLGLHLEFFQGSLAGGCNVMAWWLQHLLRTWQGGIVVLISLEMNSTSS